MGKLSEQIKEAAAEDDKRRESLANERVVSKLRTELAHEKALRKQAEIEIEAAEQRVDFIRGLDEPTDHGYRFKSCKPSGQATAILVLSDWHVEETVDPLTINGKNEFNLDIASKRIQRMFENAAMLIDHERGLSKIADLVIAPLGDFITGYIHPELEENNSLSPTEAIEFAMDHLHSGIQFMLKHSGCKSITLPTAYGNHGRTTLKPRRATGHKNSYEWLMYRFLAKLYANEPRVKWKVENGAHNLLEIQGRLFRFQHGDAFRYKGGVGGPTIPILRKIGRWDKAIDVFGHLHFHLPYQPNFVLNNSLIGYGAFSLFEAFPEVQPSQTLLIVDRKHQWPVTVKEIWCKQAQAIAA